MKTIRTITVIAGTMMTLAAAAQGATIVHWEGDYVSALQPTQATGYAPSSDHIWPTGNNTNGTTVQGVKWTSALNPVIGDDYNGPSAAFYGSVSGGRTNNNGAYSVSTVAFYVVDGGANDQLYFDITNNNDNARAGAGAALWDKSGFLDGGAGMALGLDQSGSNPITKVSLKLGTVGEHVQQLRVLLRNDQTYYVSDLITNFTATTNGTPSVDGATLAATSFWAVPLELDSFKYTNMNGTSKLGASVLGSTLTNITGIGFSFSSGGESGKLNADFEVISFKVEAVPEPTMAGVLGLAALGLRRSGRRGIL